ncbi:ANTAR domain-containing protein [Chelatococcus sp. SYSU_G07232]|uniref:ANTAR domain-containing protein n=1 Tax=Chelatococcus albus TaxID=3047466 RepID=A0ABT7AKY1_9HYPH|nr:ANTAR domain-containing protein [Chelatococcus sp. SYSU_G07232]MDJ1160024.1 ANTAR domain-containing protein [Chelatococcus sp. SYSU_G07232]
MDRHTRIVIIDESAIRRAILEEGLREAGYADIVSIGETDQLLAKLDALEPDVIIIDLENPSRDVLEQMFQISRLARRPVAMFVDQSDTAMIAEAIDAGVSAYVVDGLRKERVKPILETAIMRFNAFTRLRDELERTKSKLEERKIVDRAKGILMKMKGIGEEEAYRLLRRTAMNENRTIIEVARSVITAAELLK